MSKTSKAPKNDRQRRIEEARRRQAAQERRRRLIIGAAVLAVLVVVAVIGIVVQSNRSGSAKSTASTRPSGVLANGAIPMGAAVSAGQTAPTLDIYEDFQCPYCGQLEQGSGADLQQLATAGSVQLRYHLLSFIGLDSVRAANAAGCAVDVGAFAPYHAKLYANQPKENTNGYSTDNLLKWGAEVGLTTPAFTDCVRTSRYQGWVKQVQDQSSKDGIVQTPTLLLNGKPVDNAITLQPAQLKAAILAAKGG